MNFAKITLSVALLGALTLGMADDASTNTTDSTSTSTSVDTQIEAIQTAPAQERVQLMNEFKQRLMNMNDAQRSAALTKLQENMQATQTFSQTTQGEAHNMPTQTGTMAAPGAQELQMQTNDQMNHMQNMTQQQSGSQFVQTGGVSGGGAGGAGAPAMNTNMMQHR